MEDLLEQLLVETRRGNAMMGKLLEQLSPSGGGLGFTNDEPRQEKPQIYLSGDGGQAFWYRLPPEKGQPNIWLPGKNVRCNIQDAQLFEQYSSEFGKTTLKVRLVVTLPEQKELIMGCISTPKNAAKATGVTTPTAAWGTLLLKLLAASDEQLLGGLYLIPEHGSTAKSVSFRLATIEGEEIYSQKAEDGTSSNSWYEYDWPELTFDMAKRIRQLRGIDSPLDLEWTNSAREAAAKQISKLLWKEGMTELEQRRSYIHSIYRRELLALTPLELQCMIDSSNRRLEFAANIANRAAA